MHVLLNWGWTRGFKSSFFPVLQRWCLFFSLSPSTLSKYANCRHIQPSRFTYITLIKKSWQDFQIYSFWRGEGRVLFVRLSFQSSIVQIMSHSCRFFYTYARFQKGWYLKNIYFKKEPLFSWHVTKGKYVFQMSTFLKMSVYDLNILKLS